MTRVYGNNKVVIIIILKQFMDVLRTLSCFISVTDTL